MERRREDRLGVELPGSYQARGLHSSCVFFARLSANGCQMTDYESPLVPGDAIRLSLGAVETVDATVVWVRDHVVGVKFATPLDDFVLTFFAAYISKAA